jgi:hypothetical protein
MNKYDAARSLIDLQQAREEQTDVPNMTGAELATTLGLELDANGECDLTTFFNACLGVLSNEAVQQLPQEVRLRVIRSAADALSIMRGTRG